MARLALAVENESLLAFDRAELVVDRRTVSAAARRLGDTILLYRNTDAGIEHFATARVTGIDELDGARFYCRLRSVKELAAPVAGAEEARVPGVARFVTLPDERFEEILGVGSNAGPLAGFVSEAGSPVTPVRPLDDFLAIRAEVLHRWEYRCAVTLSQYAPGEARELRLVPIRPRDRGGPLEPRNYLPMVELAEHAWRNGTLSVTEDLRFVMVIDRLNPDLLGAMPSKLLVPDDPALGPDPAHLAYHRTNVFGG